MRIRHERRADKLTVYFSGELDHHTAALAREKLDALLADSAIKTLVFDFSGLSFMDSSGLGFILGRYKQMARRGGRTAVRGADRQVERLLSLSGIYQLLEKRKA